MHILLNPDVAVMTAAILDGKRVAAIMRRTMTAAIAQRISTMGVRSPCLAVIVIGDDQASELYVKRKREACTEVGIRSMPYFLPKATQEEALLTLITTLNRNEDIDGILVQLPLPSHIHTATVIEHIDPSKDVDGFHPLNMGRLAQGHPFLRPCTPWGIIHLLQHYQLPLSGLSTVVIGASNIVGRPLALELLLAKATVTIAQRNTRNLEEHVRQADVIVSATGVPDVIQTAWLSQKQIVIDVGIHRSVSGQIHGDIDFRAAEQKVAWISPVPGGVGPMTVAILLKNTLSCWTKTQGLPDSIPSSV